MTLVAAISSLMIVLGVCAVTTLTGQVVKRIKSVTIEGETAKYLRLNNLALEGRPQDLAFTTHVCRGNYNSTWAASGGYEPVAPILIRQRKM